jgi:hypothetical protein
MVTPGVTSANMIPEVTLMPKPIDIFELLRRGGDMTDAEVTQLTDEMTEAKVSDLAAGTLSRAYDQPVKVVPWTGQPPAVVGGYFTQEKFICGKNPQEMGQILGVFGKFSNGAYILEFVSPLRAGDFEGRAYTYLPDGKPYVPKPNEETYLPGRGAPQWELKGIVQARCIATLKPGEVYIRKSVSSR